jgi:hypothetical protein
MGARASCLCSPVQPVFLEDGPVALFQPIPRPVLVGELVRNLWCNCQNGKLLALLVDYGVAGLGCVLTHRSLAQACGAALLVRYVDAHAGCRLVLSQLAW